MAQTRTAMLRLSALVGERTLFENEAFRRLWLARLLSHIPVSAVVYAMLIMVVRATGRSVFSSIFVAAYIAPTALLGTVSGVLVDRMPKGLVLAGANAARGGLCVLLAFSVDNVLAIYLVAVLFALTSLVAGPAEGAALPLIVEPEKLTSANSLNNLGSLVAQVAGLMVLAPIFLKTVGPEPLALIAAIMFGASVFNFLLVPGLGGGPSGDIPASVQASRERFAEAWHRLSMDSVSYVSTVLVVIANTIGLVVVTLVPRFCSRVLGVNSENAVFVAAPAALGIWLALRFVRQVSSRVSPWIGIGGSFCALVGGVALLAFVAPLGDALRAANPAGLFDPGPFGQGSARIIITAMLGAGLAFAFTFVNVVGRTIVNERMPREMQGRVFAGQTVLTNLASIPPILLTGFLADVIGIAPVFFLVAVSCAVFAAYYAARNLAMPVRTAY